MGTFNNNWSLLMCLLAPFGNERPNANAGYVNLQDQKRTQYLMRWETGQLLGSFVR